MSSSVTDRGAPHAARGTVLSALNAILEGSPDPALVVDAAGRVRSANPAVCGRLGWSRESLLASSLDALVPDRRALAAIAQVRAKGAHTELELRHRDGSRLRTSISVTPIRLADFSGVLLFLRDPLGHRRLVEAERKSTELEQTARAISHDLRSPLVAVLGFSRLLREDYEALLDEKGRHFLERIEQAARTMESLIRDFLEFSRIGHERERPEGMADPREVLLQLRGELKPRLDTTRIRLELPSDAPLIHCERTRLYQIFSNLIGNALDHMGPASEPWIEVRVLEEPRHHHIVVSDNGAGIDLAQHQTIFEPFSGRCREGLAGTGIGLAIVRKIAEVHGGRAWVESRRGRGAEFHVTLRRP